ncbi:MAG: hypothetical protein LUI12_01820 [Clostridiales bacterium]|nr:hypothetical protein [Clostridiales bacterium]
MKRVKKRGKIEKALDNSFINYFSDLFIVFMVLGWVIVLIIMIGMAIYATISLGETSMWSYVGDLVAIPLSCGGAIWMVKNSVQHAIANRNGKLAHMDFPKIDVGNEETEKEMFAEMEVTDNGVAG